MKREMARQENDMANMFQALFKTVQSTPPQKFESFQSEKTFPKIT